MTLGVLFLILALVCFLLAAFRTPGPMEWVPLGYAFVTCWALFGYGAILVR